MGNAGTTGPGVKFEVFARYAVVWVGGGEVWREVGDL